MAGAVDLQLPPGFRFHPTDDELVMHYLCRKCASQQIDVPIIKELDLYKHDPWDLPGLALYGDKEWYFFSPRERKYPNGSRPNRAAGSGYWKATGADKAIGSPKTVGIKKALVFYAGKPPRGQKTNWIMHEYRLAQVDRSAKNKNQRGSKLDDWVLCRIYNKKGSLEKHNANRAAANDMAYLDTSDSVPKLHTDSSCSEQVVSTELREVESQPKLESTTLEYPHNYMPAPADFMLSAPRQPPQPQSATSTYEMAQWQDVFMYLQRSL
ncbi:hypothetical protein DCAR_0519039 [Daucus carota subsp. sativus]|uniref:NAC domain-containing protein n=1 Tax=Daucus carota subsp. sativus TaxID=79200 RepID=A0A164XP00_DAUCS|nr:PREDICTED: NAC domain-containing protein 2-like [Daucus carota subsp. sativus]WOG99685.1 hypothetical protein DCAR_0519039 [Daucus carota subsp. sativus]